MVWPWKRTNYMTDEAGVILLDSNDNKIAKNFERYMPDPANPETWYAVLFIIGGIGILMALEWYGKNRTNKA